MKRFILGRIVQAFVCMLAVSVIVFLLVRLTGNPVYLYVDEYATKEDYQTISARFGLDKPLPIQYAVFVKNALRGDFGNSIKSGQPALKVALERLPATMELGVVAIVVSLVIALPVGVLAAVRRGTGIDAIVRAFAILGQATPSFWLALVLMLVFAVWFGILPSAGMGSPKHLVLPAVTMGWYISAGIMRITRSSMLEVLDSEYVKLLRAKGLPEWQVIWKHALKNAAIPILTYSVILFVLVLAGSVIVETVFAWPGMGRLAIQSVQWRDFPVVQTVVIIIATMYIVANLIVDILYAYLNPKVRF